MTSTEQKPWVPFYFNGNQYFGDIKSRDDWKELVAAYGGDVEFLKQAHSSSNSSRGVQDFGLYEEYQDSPTLGEWAEANNLAFSI